MDNELVRAHGAVMWDPGTRVRWWHRFAWWRRPPAIVLPAGELHSGDRLEISWDSRGLATWAVRPGDPR